MAGGGWTRTSGGSGQALLLMAFKADRAWSVRTLLCEKYNQETHVPPRHTKEQVEQGSERLLFDRIRRTRFH